MKDGETRFDRMDVSPKDTSEAPKGEGIFYQCTACLSIVPCTPDDNTGCRCGNVFVDVDYHRLSVKDFDHFAVLKRSSLGAQRQ